MYLTYLLTYLLTSPAVRGVARSKNVGWTTGRACREPSQISNLTDPYPRPEKLTGSASVPRTPSGKSGVYMSTPVYPVVTPRAARCPLTN